LTFSILNVLAQASVLAMCLEWVVRFYRETPGALSAELVP
jgi:hypothetical protein